MVIENWKSQTKKGTLELAILLCLKDKEKYGLELIKDLQLSQTEEISEGTIYPLLYRLKTEQVLSSHWIESDSGHPRKYYSLTAKGRKLLLEMISYWKELSTKIQKLIGEKNERG